MQRLLLVVPLLALLFAMPSAAQSQTHTVDYVLGMLHAGMENDAIIAHILGEDIGFRVQAGDISRLRAAGGSDALIEAVVREGVILTGEGEPAAAGEASSHPQRIEPPLEEADGGVSTGEEVAGEAVIVEEAEPAEECYYVESDCYDHGHWSGSFYVGVGWGWWDPWPVYYGPYWVGYWGYPYYPAWGYPAYPYYYGGRGGYHNYYYARTEPRGSGSPAGEPRGVTTVGYPTDPGSRTRGGPRGATTVASNNDLPGAGGGGAGNGSAATDPASRGRRGSGSISGTARSGDRRSQAMSDDSISGSRRSSMVSGNDGSSRPRRSSVSGSTQSRGQGRSSVSGDTRSSSRNRSSVSGNTRSSGRSRSSVSDNSRSRGRSGSSVSGRSRSGGGSRSGVSSRSSRSGGRSSASMSGSRGGSSYRGASGRGGGGHSGGSGGGSRGGGSSSRGGGSRR